MNLEGRLIANRYELIEKVGNGGMATVYRAKDRMLNRFVAVKILRDEFTTDQEFIKRFNSEAQAVASLANPNIVAVYDVGNEGNLYYIVMELIQGHTLKEIIQQEGKISWKWSLKVAIQIAKALDTAHKNNIIHRDIKPHNIIITEDGMAKVTDFGIAKAVSNSTITAFGTTLGSVHYFSPEHARGGFTDAKSDLYSLGVVMYEMLTGKVPFDADTPVSVALMHIQEKPVEPILLNPNIPECVNKIVVKAMQKDANLRYQSAQELLRDLNMALKNPDGNFVFIKDTENDFPTQKIPVIGNEPTKTKKENTRKKKENRFVKFIKKHKVISFIVSAILLFVLTIAITYFGLKLTKVKDIQIPNLVGLSIEEAKKKIEDAKLVYNEQEQQYSSEVQAGYVISQDPTYIENYKIKEGTEIKVVISKGQEITKVPKVIGMKKEDAISALEDAKLKYEVIEETSKTVEEGYVVSQEIKENTEVNAGETVKIHVSIGTGIEQVSMPYVIGKTEAEARKAIEESKLKVKQVIYEEDKTKNDGTVIKQEKEAGSTLDEGTEVIITVNKIAQIKTGTVKINVKSITGYEPPKENKNNNTVTEEEKTETKAEQVTLKVTVNDEQVEEKKVSEASTSENVKVQGVGTITIKVYINGNLKRTQQFNLNNSTELTIE